MNVKLSCILWLFFLSGVLGDEALEASNRTRHLRRVQDFDQPPPPNHAVQVAFDPHNYTCNREERLSERCRWCNRDLPNDVGSWAPFPPYWQHPSPCEIQAFDVQNTRKCMQGRTLYVIGNSVARQNAFNMIEMLGGNPVKREDQKDQCPKHHPVWGDSCHSEMAGVKIKYLYLQFMDGFNYQDRGGFPYFRHQQVINDKLSWTTGRISYLNSTTGSVEYHSDIKSAHADGGADVWIDDNCVHQDTRTCLKKFFAGSTSQDVLIFTLGMAYGMYDIRMDHEEPKHSPGVDYRAWLVASAAAFRAHLSATFPGQVFRATMAEFQSGSYMSSKTANIAVVNDLLDRSWRPGSEELPWYTIDQWAINKNRHYLYNDPVHFSGPLSRALLQQVLNELCPRGGEDAWLYSSNITDAMSNFNKAFILKQTVSRVSVWYAVLYKGKRHNIPNMDTLNGLEVSVDLFVEVTKEEFAMFPEGEPLVPCDKAAVPNICKDSVYFNALHNSN